MNDLGNTESSTGFLDKTLYSYFLLLLFLFLLVLPAYVSPHSPPYSFTKPLVFALEENTKSEIFFFLFFLIFLLMKERKKKNTKTWAPKKQQMKYKKVV